MQNIDDAVQGEGFVEVFHHVAERLVYLGHVLVGHIRAVDLKLFQGAFLTLDETGRLHLDGFDHGVAGKVLVESGDVFAEEILPFCQTVDCGNHLLLGDGIPKLGDDAVQGVLAFQDALGFQPYGVHHGFRGECHSEFRHIPRQALLLAVEVFHLAAQGVDDAFRVQGSFKFRHRAIHCLSDDGVVAVELALAFGLDHRQQGFYGHRAVGTAHRDVRQGLLQARALACRQPFALFVQGGKDRLQRDGRHFCQGGVHTGA